MSEPKNHTLREEADRTPEESDPARTAGPLGAGEDTTAETPEDARKSAEKSLRDHTFRIPGYDVLGELGRGGMGVVYKARHLDLGRIEVVKVMDDRLAAKPEAVERFKREIRTASQLHHPNIVTVHSFVRTADRIGFTMEFVDGQDLAAAVEARGRLPVTTACQYAYQAALGLQHAHEKGLVHRDVKPANLILAVEGANHRVKILDFGIAKAASENETAGGLTGTGVTVGTPAYMAPEQALDAANADGRADVYSLGCTLYYLLAGRPPFFGKTPFALHHAHQTAAAEPLDRVRPEVPAALAAVVARMMAKEPEDRFQTPGDAAAALTPYFDAGSVTSAVRHAVPAGSRPSKPRHFLFLLLSAVGAALLVLVAAWAAGAFHGKPEIGPTGSEIIASEPAATQPAEERSFEIAPGVKMVFCRIPSGTATLGSPASESERREDENEHAYISTGFWLGKYPVTQEEWRAVVGTDPSTFDGTKDNAAKGMTTARFPVETVSWNDCQDFLARVNSRPGSATAFGRPGRFVLPREDEWEYACRGRKGNRQPYYFGDRLTGTEANCDGTLPYGTSKKGPYLVRPTPVGNYQAVAPHPWRLCDMHGNVWQWCENMSNREPTSRILRGGSWKNYARSCRAAFRDWLDSDHGFYSVGFRVCFRPD